MVGIAGFAGSVGSVRIRALGWETEEQVVSAESSWESSWDAAFFFPFFFSLSLTTFFAPVCQS